MRLERHYLKESCESVLSAIALEQPLAPALDNVARSSGGHSACFWRSTPSSFSFVGNGCFSDGMTKVGRTGEEPWSADVVIAARTDEGFVSNTDRRIFPKLMRLGFYQDVMCRHDFHWYAGLNLGTRNGATTFLTVWRSKAEGQIEEDELSALDSVGRDLRLAYAFAERLADKDEERQAAPFANRGEALFRLDALGATTPTNVAAQRLVAGGTLRLTAGRLATSLKGETDDIGRMVAAAVKRPGVPGSALVACPLTGRRWQLLALPIQGDALDVFGATRALVAAINVDARLEPDTRTLRFLMSGFRLTERETAVAGLVAKGSATIDVAAMLRIGHGTTRNHLKSAMHKIGVTSQAQLAALVARYS